MIVMYCHPTTTVLVEEIRFNRQVQSRRVRGKKEEKQKSAKWVDCTSRPSSQKGPM